MTVVAPYKTDGGEVLKRMLVSPSSGWPVWVPTATGTVLIAIGAFTDVRWLAVGLMLCICMAPCIAAMLYFIHVLSPEVVPNMLPHTLERIDEGYVLRTWRHADPEEAEDAGEWIETGMVRLEDANITKRKTSFEYVTLYFRDSRMKILYVPRLKK